MNELLQYPLESETTKFPKIEPTTTCNGKIHRQFRYCKRPAGSGTSHLGSGRCKLHGGCSTGSKSGKLRYSDFVPTDIIEKYEEFATEAPEDIKSLNEEIALVRAKIANLENTNNDGRHDIKICNMIELVRRLAESKTRIEEGIKSHITVEVIGKAVESFIAIVERHVSDLELKKRLANDLRRLNETDLGIKNLN